MTRFLLPATAVCAFLWAVARAALQAITIDEANNYLNYVAPPDASIWAAASNNHILNSALMRLATAVFGVSHFTVRLPALLGAAIYLGASFSICRRLSEKWYVQWPVFVCLAFNPLVGDFLVAARGYGMALGFLLAGQAVLQAASPPTIRIIVLASAFTALSVTANFSFALVAAVALLAIAYQARRDLRTVELTVATLLPVAAVAFFGPLWTLRRFPQSELVYGSKTLLESAQSLYDATLYQLNPELASPLILQLFGALKHALIPAVAISAVAWAIYIWKKGKAGSKFRVAATMVVIPAAALVIHAGAHYFTGLLLPKDRTGIYIPVLLTIAAGLLAAIPAPARASRILRGALHTSLFTLAAYFLFSLRLDHFKEWPWDAETDKLYATLACLNHEHGVRDVASIWMYEGPLNFYRLASGKETLLPIVDPEAEREGTQVYVINARFDANLVGEKGLQLAAVSPSTDALIGVKPELYATISSSPCLE